jgi:hypothetical protein
MEAAPSAHQQTERCMNWCVPEPSLQFRPLGPRRLHDQRTSSYMEDGWQASATARVPRAHCARGDAIEQIKRFARGLLARGTVRW